MALQRIVRSAAAKHRDARIRGAARDENSRSRFVLAIVSVVALAFLVASPLTVRPLTGRYGERLLCVRYRYDEQGRKRLKTVKLIEEEVAWIASGGVYLVKIGPRRSIFESRRNKQRLAAERRVEAVDGDRQEHDQSAEGAP